MNILNKVINPKRGSKKKKNSSNDGQPPLVSIGATSACSPDQYTHLSLQQDNVLPIVTPSISVDAVSSAASSRNCSPSRKVVEQADSTSCRMRKGNGKNRKSGGIKVGGLVAMNLFLTFLQ